MENETPPPPLAPIAYPPIVVPIILAAVFNLIVPSMFGPRGPGEVIMMFVAGILVGEFGLLATWAVLGPGRLYPQWFEALLVGLGLFLAFVAGIVVAEGHGFPARNEFFQMILAIVALLVATEVPLWCIRLFRGWRLVFRGKDAARTAIESRQLQIRDILIVMTILAVFLGTMSLAAKGNNGRDDTEFLIFASIGCGVAVVWSALVLPICLWTCFGASAIGVRIGVLTGYLITMATAAIGVTVAVSGRDVPPDAIAFFLLLHVALLATLFSGLWLAGACGYVLVSVRSARRRPPAETGSPFAPSEESPA